MNKVWAYRQYGREALLALLVIALTFLNFGHTSAVFAAGGRVVVTGTSWCGDPVAPKDGEHFTCHACRQDAPALPPAPVAVAPVQFNACAVAYSADPAAMPAPSVRFAVRPRGPPVLA